MYGFKPEVINSSPIFPTWESLKAWETLFQVEGTLLGVVRKLHEQSYDRLLSVCHQKRMFSIMSRHTLLHIP